MLAHAMLAYAFMTHAMLAYARKAHAVMAHATSAQLGLMARATLPPLDLKVPKGGEGWPKILGPGCGNIGHPALPGEHRPPPGPGFKIGLYVQGCKSPVAPTIGR